MTVRAVCAAIALAACGHAPPRPTHAPAGPTVLHPDLPPGFTLDIVLHLQPHAAARLRLDGGGRPYLVTRDTFVPLMKLSSGTAAQPFKLANAASIDDIAWVDEGVMLVVVGDKLGTTGEHGFTEFATLPATGMHIAPAGTDRCWIYGKDGALYVYEQSGSVTELVHAPGQLRAVSGTPAHAVLAIDGSLVRIDGATTSLLFDGAEPIVAVADTSGGVFFSTASGTFVLTPHGHVLRLTKDGALAIASHGDAVFLQLDAIGVVEAHPASAFAQR